MWKTVNSKDSSKTCNKCQREDVSVRSLQVEVQKKGYYEETLLACSQGIGNAVAVDVKVVENCK